MASAIRLHIHHAGPRIDRAGPETTRTPRDHRGMGKQNDDETNIVPSRHDAF